MKICVFDLETNGLLDTVSRIHCGVFYDIKTKETVTFTPENLQDMTEFMDGCDVLIGHNVIGYDFPVLKKVLGWEFKGKKVDTLIMSRLLNPKRILPINAENRKAGPHSIYAWGVRQGIDKPEHEDWARFSPEMLHRCIEDVRINVGTYNLLLKEAKGQNWRNAFIMTFELFTYLQKQEEYGWKVDVKHMQDSINTLSRWIRRIDEAITPRLPYICEIGELREKGGGDYKYVKKPFLISGKYAAQAVKLCDDANLDINDRPVVGVFSRIGFRQISLDSTKEIKEYLLSLGWEPLEWNYDDDGNKTSPKLSKDDPFDGIEDKLGKIVAKRIQCKQRRGILEGLLALVRKDGTISSVVNNLAVTGRATHRNIVNIPGAKSFFGKQMRKCFSSREGMVLVGTDSDACQIRMLAARMNDPDYIETVINGDKAKGTDMHTVNMKAAQLPDRDSAKTFFYGFLFGAGDAKIGKIVKGTAARGKKLKADFLEGLPALGALLEKLNKEWRATARKKFNPRFNTWEFFDGKITGLDGRPIVVPSEHQILVYLLQSDESIMMTMAYIKANRDLIAKGYVYGEDYGFVCWMHDEFTIECKEAIAEDVKAISENAIEWAGKYFKITCPHIGQGQIGKDWYDIH